MMNIILTPREKEIFDLLVKNQSTKEIAKTLKSMGVPMDTIVQSTQLSAEEIEQL